MRTIWRSPKAGVQGRFYQSLKSRCLSRAPMELVICCDAWCSRWQAKSARQRQN
ncbi:hypothetical protein LEMLEM_LOCUS7464 [Lemmus lemmus]